MRQSRILPLLGPAAVLYLVADAAATSGRLSLQGICVAAVCLVCSLTALWVRSRMDGAGARRVAGLGVGFGMGLLAAIEPGELSVVVDAAAALGAAAGGALIVDLAATVPDAPQAFGRARTWRPALIVAAAVSFVAGVVAVLPPLELGTQTLVVSPRYAVTPALFALASATVALLLRIARRRLGSGPEALASNAWALMGLLPAVLGGGTAAALAGFGVLPVGSGWVGGLTAVAVLSAVIGHLTLVDARRRLQAGRVARRALALLLTLAAVATAVAVLRHVIPREPYALGAFAAAVLVFGVIVFRALLPLVRRIIAPWGGRLLEGARSAREGIGAAASLEELARAVLGPLRAAAAADDAQPLLYTVDPPREVRTDAAGEPHVRRCEVPTALLGRLMEHPREVVVRRALEDQVVRRAELRQLVEELVAFEALCVVPLAVRGELEGALVVPRGRRKTAPSLEEIAELEALGNRVSGLVSVVSAQARAQRRAGEMTVARDRAEERTEALQEEVERLRADVRALRAGRAAGRLTAPSVSYSPAMRTLETRIDELAPMDVPVLLVAEGGTAIDFVAASIHGRSGRADGPFVIADCGSVRPEHTRAALCGGEGAEAQPGWLPLASGGTLLLADVPALSLDAQRALVEALAARRVEPTGGAGSQPVDVRVVATSRLELGRLVEVGAFDPELAQWLSKFQLQVPPLRQRRQDIPSLVLLALDRACRVLGREALGIEQEALDVLLEHEWRGNLRELQHVIERAVAAAPGPQVRRADLPPLPAPRTEAPDPAQLPDATYAELEKRILSRAMQRARGNKSEAARLLDLKRSTFVDKLRRHGLEGKGADGKWEAAS